MRFPVKVIMKIAYDPTIFSSQARGGVSRSIVEVARRVACYDRVDARIYCPLNVNEHLAQYGNPDFVTGFKLPKIPHTIRLFTHINYFFWDIWARRWKPDVVHITHYVEKKRFNLKCKYVVTAYDFIEERLSHLFPPHPVTQRKKRDSLLTADHIICISENTRHDLLDLYGVDANKTSVIHLGVSLNRGPDTPARQATDSKYILYVGARHAYKNFGKFISAFSKIKDKDINLICCGGGPFNPGELELLAGLGIRAGRIRQIDGDDNSLVGLYEKAELFVYPSLYEGFGIPLVEAMYCECPVICSRTSCFPEVCDDAAIYFDPLRVEDITEKINFALENPGALNRLRQLGSERAKIFTWDKCAKATMGVYQQLAPSLP